MGFLGDFVSYLKTRTHAPPDFHINGGMAALSMALGNRVWCDGFTNNYHANLWIVLIGKSGIGKSAPLHLSQTLVQRAGLENSVLPPSFSREAMYDALRAADCTGAWYLQEFAAFLGVIEREYNSGLMAELTDLYDVPDRFTRALRPQGGQARSIVLEKPFITILGASSPTWFAQAYRGSMLEGGFLARFIFCPSSTVGAYVDDPGPRDISRENGLVRHLAAVRKLSGRVDYASVRPKLIEWEREAWKRQMINCPPEFEGMRKRSGALVRKTTMLFMVSRNPETMVPVAQDLDNAIRYVEASQARAEVYLSNEVAHNRDDAEALRVLDVVRRSGGVCAWSTTLKNSHLGGTRFKWAVDTLVQSERVKVRRSGAHGGQEIHLTEELNHSQSVRKRSQNSQELTESQNGMAQTRESGEQLRMVAS